MKIFREKFNVLIDYCRNKRVMLLRAAVFAPIFFAAVFGAASLAPVFNLGSIKYAANNDEAVQNTPPEIIHLATPNPLKAIYMTSWVAGTDDFRDSLINFIDASEINAVVIDVKDYSGRIAFETDDPELQKTGASEKRIADIRELIRGLHDKDIYVIARISVFQDSYMVKRRPDLAILSKTGGIWKDYKGVSWLDQCSHEVWDYTIRIAREAERAGFDELNFDYIRFPSDGNMKNIQYAFCDPKISKADALEEFFKYLSDNLQDIGVPLSADLFGMVTVNTDDLNIGQVLEKAAPYFDYIAPMVYPSHYPKGFKGYQNPASHPYEIIFDAMTVASGRLIAASSSPEKLRPWIQDFDLGATYDAEMINKEKQAVYDAGLASWMAWDASNKYTRDAY